MGSSDLVFRRSVELLVGSVLAGAVVLSAFADPPDLPACFETLSASQRAAVEDFRHGAVAIHTSAIASLLVGLGRLSAARRPSGRPSIGTTVMIGAYAVILAATLAEPDVLAVAGVAQVFFGVVLWPVVAAATIAAAIALTAPRARAFAPTLVTWAAWMSLTLFLPAHFAMVWLVDEPFCMS